MIKHRISGAAYAFSRENKRWLIAGVYSIPALLGMAATATARDEFHLRFGDAEALGQVVGKLQILLMLARPDFLNLGAFKRILQEPLIFRRQGVVGHRKQAAVAGRCRWRLLPVPQAFRPVPALALLPAPPSASGPRR